MKRVWFLVMNGLLWISICHGGGFSADSIGTAGGQFLSMGGGARPLGMGGAYTAVSDDAAGVYWNPAGLTQVANVSLMLMHANYLADINFDHMSFVYRGGVSAFGAAVSQMNAGPISRTDAGGNSLGEYTPRDYVGVVSMAMKTSDPFSLDDRGFFGIGMNAKYLKSRIIEEAGTFAVDVGILGKSVLSDGKSIRYGFVARNIGPEITYDKEGAPLPFVLKGGLALDSGRSLLLAGDVVFPRANQPYVALGLECRAWIADGAGAVLRLGGNTQAMNSLGGLAGLSAGAGINFKAVSIDYAVNGFGELGSSHMISLTLKFGGDGEDEVKRPRGRPSWRTQGHKKKSKPNVRGGR